MVHLTHQLVTVAVVLSVAQIITGYSFKNCIEEPYSERQTFNCIRRKDYKLSDFVVGLPLSAVNLTIAVNPIWHIPDRSFAHLPNLQYLSMDRNHVRQIDVFAFQNLSQLRSLNLSFNNITELKPSLFHDLCNLTLLSLKHNKLKQLPEGIFSTLSNLDTLILQQNFLMNFSRIAKSVSYSMKLRVLDICSNNLTSLSHSDVELPQSLSMLYVCKNNLSTLECKQSFLRGINILDLSDNARLPTLAFQAVDLSRLYYLRLRSTSVSVTELLKISNIHAGHIDFSGTGLNNDSVLMGLCFLLNSKAKIIKKMHLALNGISDLTDKTLRYCPKITEVLDLSRNNLKQTACLDFLGKQRHIKILVFEHNHITNLPDCTKHHARYPNMEELHFRYNRILSVNAFAFRSTPKITTLRLNINTIAFLHRSALKELTRLTMLRLDNNLLTDLFNDTFEDLVSLETLNLRNNRIAVIFNGTFLHLSNLTILDLGGNKITHIQPSGLDGLHSLSKLYLDGNNLKEIDASLNRVFESTLTTLDLQRNNIRFLSENINSPFMNLSTLLDLKLDGQLPYGLTILPRHFFHGLQSLESLYLTNNRIANLAPDAFDDLKSLHFLTLESCCVGVVQLQPGVFKNLRNVSRLIVENTGIQNFSKEVFGNLTKLHTLQLNRNVMQSIDVDVLDSLPKLRYLDLRNIPLSCTCQNSLLQNWTSHNPKVQVVYLYNLPCPHNEKSKFYNFDTKVCYLDLGEYLFLSTAIVTFAFTFIPLIYVKLYWKMKYGYYVFRSWFGEQWRTLREKEENCKYDAFISYNSSDETWVMEQLLPNMEGNGSSFKLCLHHRDFELGRDIVDNIVTAVYSSRKTICVVSRNFLQSEWCSLEIQLASYRLFDEHRDVLLLVFLEPISERQMSSYHRMRKVMLKKTYLQWPGTDCTSPLEAQELFWNQLRRAMRTGSKLENELSEDRLSPDSKETGDSGTHTSDENYYLHP
ncbi:toll-like receptor 21 [Aulostomus maculatus]